MARFASWLCFSSLPSCFFTIPSNRLTAFFLHKAVIQDNSFLHNKKIIGNAGTNQLESGQKNHSICWYEQKNHWTKKIIRFSLTNRKKSGRREKVQLLVSSVQVSVNAQQSQIRTKVRYN